MMRKLDKRGVAALEFCLVAVPLFTLMFVIFDLGRYALTVQSLWTLANAGARAVMINCYTPDVAVNNTSPSGCTCTSPTFPCPSAAAVQTVAPFLYFDSLSPTLTVTAGSHTLTVTASQTGFAMLMPIWGTALRAPSVSTSIPF